MKINGSVALVTGVNGDIGRASVQKLLRRGAVRCGAARRGAAWKGLTRRAVASRR
jgi:NAD(P)-dependent dehydrogenase (short-subunit alcohol dehydrogenase family)